MDRGAADNQAYANGYEAGYKKAFNAMTEALEESLKLQSHYAKILNDYDGGTRLTFANAEEWVSRLAELERDRKLDDMRREREASPELCWSCLGRGQWLTPCPVCGKRKGFEAKQP